jgi:lactam utilization protein B
MWEGGPDKELMPMIDAANIACGGHAGDPVIMRRTVALAKEFGVKVGARKSSCSFKTDPKTPGFLTRPALGDGYWR